MYGHWIATTEDKNEIGKIVPLDDCINYLYSQVITNTQTLTPRYKELQRCWILTHSLSQDYKMLEVPDLNRTLYSASYITSVSVEQRILCLDCFF